jgi:alkylhydroperoxidase family enzyme
LDEAHLECETVRLSLLTGGINSHFSEEALVNLTIAIIATNGWNRLNIAFRPEVGDYRPGMFDQPKTAQAAIST